MYGTLGTLHLGRFGIAPFATLICSSFATPCTWVVLEIFMTSLSVETHSICREILSSVLFVDNLISLFYKEYIFYVSPDVLLVHVTNYVIV